MRTSSFMVVLAGAVLGCQSVRPPESRLPVAGTTTGGGTGVPSLAESSSEDSGSVLLDLGDADLPSTECESVDESSMSEELPSDVIIVAGPEVEQYLVYAAVQNLSPQLYAEGVPETRVILIAGPPPSCPPPPEVEFGDNECCDNWRCWRASVPWNDDFFVIEADIDPDTPLTDLLALSDQWQPLLREDSWKHVWLNASRGADSTTSGGEFADAFRNFGASYANFAFHTLLHSGFVDDEYVQLSRDTEGVHYPRGADGEGEVYLDFVTPLQDLLLTNPLSCVYEIPDPPQGQTFDRDQVNVEYDVGFGPTTLGRVDSRDACAAVGNGWYYDDPADPREIVICPESCGVFQMQEVASVAIQFGCATIPAG